MDTLSLDSKGGKIDAPPAAPSVGPTTPQAPKTSGAKLNTKVTDAPSPPRACGLRG
jgi:hypothetical protein